MCVRLNACLGKICEGPGLSCLPKSQGSAQAINEATAELQADGGHVPQTHTEVLVKG